MAELVALDLPGGSSFVDALRRAWEDGDAVLPVDRRLPPAARARLLERLAPSALVDPAGRHRLDGIPVEEGDALVMATSGSTGDPKGVVLTHGALRAASDATSARLGTGDADTWLACLPLSHVGGLGVVVRALHTGAGLVVHDGFDAGNVEAAARNGATAVSLVATALGRIDPSLFRVILVGGGRPPALLPAHAHVTYGLTETGGGIAYDGRALDGVDIEVVDGEVLVRGPMLLRCYRDGTDPRSPDGWLRTGDLGRFLPDGRLHVDGRAGDLIITGGENVWPDAVEAAITGHPSVREVAVAGLDDPEWGHRVVAWIVAEGEPPSLADLRARVAEHLPAFCAPKEVRVVERLPRTALGKVQRHHLRDLPAH
ncbi:MAG: class I adenylate-forming enzyme family protein [Ilumatobacteraceae bacterium]